MPTPTPLRVRLLAITIVTLMAGCAHSERPDTDANADIQRQVLASRIDGFRSAMKAGTLTPARKPELQQLATDVKAWRARTGRDDLRVFDNRVVQAQRDDDGGGGSGDCDNECPAYSLRGDSICFFSSSICAEPDDGSGDLTFGTICIYTCISMAASQDP